MEDNTDRPAYEPDSVPTGDEQPAQKIGSMQRLWMAFTSPAEVFADIKRAPTWVLCLSAMVVLGIVAQLVVLPHVDTEATLRARIADSGREMSDEQLEQMLEIGEKAAYIGPIASFVIVPIMWAIISAVFFILLKLVGSDTDYRSSLSTVLHAYWPPALVNTGLTAVLIQRVGKLPAEEIPKVVKSNLAAFLPADAPGWLQAPAQYLSVFSVWTVILLVIGFATVGGVTRNRALVVALVPWIAFMLVLAGSAALF
jgi:hypothetical protein